MEIKTYCVRCGNEHCNGDCAFKMQRLDWLEDHATVTGEQTEALHIEGLVRLEVERQMNKLMGSIGKWILQSVKDASDEKQV